MDHAGQFDAKDATGTAYSKLPKMRFPVDAQGRTLLVQDVTYYSKTAIHASFKAWRDGGPPCSGQFDPKGAWKPKLNTRTTRYDQGGKRIVGVERIFDTKIFEGNVWGLQWFADDAGSKGLFPQYYKHVGQQRVAVAAADVPVETGLLNREFRLAGPGKPARDAAGRPGGGLCAHRDSSVGAVRRTPQVRSHAGRGSECGLMRQ